VRSAGPLRIVPTVLRVAALLRISRGDMHELEGASESSISVLPGC